MSEWKTIKLSDVIQTNIATYSSNDEWEFVNYLDTGNIVTNVIASIQRIELAQGEKLPSRARRKVEIGDIIYSTVRPNQLHYGFVDNTPDNFLVSTGFAVLHPKKDKIDGKFLYYLLIQDELTEKLQAIAEQSTSAYPAIKPSDIEDLDFTIPDINEQKKISSILSAIDKKIELNTQINHNLEEQAKAIFKSWFVDFSALEDHECYDNNGICVPIGWDISCLSNVADYLNGLAMQKYRPDDGDDGYPVLKIKELRQGMCDKESERCSSSIEPEYIVHDGDVVFSWSGSLLVDFWCGGDCGLNQHLFKVTSTKFDKWFYYSWTLHHLNEFIAIAADKATTMGHIKRENLQAAVVLIPPKNVYDEIGKLLGPIYESIVRNRVESKRLAQLRDALLPKLMSGEIDVSEVEV